MKTLPYNALKMSLILILLSLGLLLTSLTGLDHFPSLSNLLFTVALVILALASLTTVTLVGLARLSGIKISQSFWVTWRMRYYCRFQTPDTTNVVVTNQVSPTAKTIRKVNLSLLTLTVTLTEQKGQLLWYLPLSHEAQEKIVELFPKVKIELNQLIKDYLFNDITRLNGNLYHAKGYKQ